MKKLGGYHPDALVDGWFFTFLHLPPKQIFNGGDFMSGYEFIMLALLLLEHKDLSKYSPEELAEEFVEVTTKIDRIISTANFS